MTTLLFMAASVNGMTATLENNEDFLSNYNWKTLCRLARDYGCFIWGRKTYEIVQGWGIKYRTDEIENARKIVLSKNPEYQVKEGYTLVNSPRQALAKLEQEGFTKVIISGGSHVNSSFAKEGLIDEIMLNFDPVILGQGIPLFAPNDFLLNTKLVSVERYEDSGVTLRYLVVK